MIMPARRLTPVALAVLTFGVTILYFLTKKYMMPPDGDRIFHAYRFTQSANEFVSLGPANAVPLEMKRGVSSGPVKRWKRGFVGDPLPLAVTNNVKIFVFFLGHPRSGHSIIASVLDAHPHIVIAHEVNVFEKILKPAKSSTEPITNKSIMFNTLWRNSYYSFRQGHRSNRATVKGYTLTIEGLYQGAYQSYIEVIGDKKAGKTSELLAYNRTKWEEVYQKLKSIVGLPIKVFHCIRNPYDNIATLIIDDSVNHGSLNYTTIGKVRGSSANYTFDPKEIEEHIDVYFEYYQAIENVKYKLDILEVHSDDLILNPRKTIIEMCNFLKVSCTETYLNICTHKIFKVSSKSRYRLVWKDYHLVKIKSHIKKFNNLQRYTEFDS